MAQSKKIKIYNDLLICHQILWVLWVISKRGYFILKEYRRDYKGLELYIDIFVSSSQLLITL